MDANIKNKVEKLEQFLWNQKVWEGLRARCLSYQPWCNLNI